MNKGSVKSESRAAVFGRNEFEDDDSGLAPVGQSIMHEAKFLLFRVIKGEERRRGELIKLNNLHKQIYNKLTYTNKKVTKKVEFCSDKHTTTNKRKSYF